MSRYDVQSRLDRGEWLAITRGVYVIDPDLYADGLTARMWWRAALLAHGPGSCLVSATALRVFGVAGLPATETEIEVTVTEGSARAKRVTLSPSPHVDGPVIVVRRLPVDRCEVVIRDGLAVRAALPSVIDAGLRLDRPTSLSILDSALHLGLATRPELEAAIALASHRRGCVALREMIPHADGRAESPLESRVRLACIDGKVPPDELQHPVYDHYGSLIAVGDMAWLRGRRRRLIGEADGASVHSLPEAVFRDRRRGNALTARGYDTVRFTWADAMRPHRVVAAVRAALAATID